jgi:hypothetical protein
VTPAALRRLTTLVEARRARDLAHLDRLLGEARRLEAEIAELRRTAARDAEDGVALPPERQAVRLVWADQRMRTARRRLAGLADAIRAARAVAAQSLGKHRSLETLADRADRAAVQAREARAEREAPPPVSPGARLS